MCASLLACEERVVEQVHSWEIWRIQGGSFEIEKVEGILVLDG